MLVLGRVALEPDRCVEAATEACVDLFERRLQIVRRLPTRRAEEVVAHRRRAGELHMESRVRFALAAFFAVSLAGTTLACLQVRSVLAIARPDLALGAATLVLHHLGVQVLFYLVEHESADQHGRLVADEFVHGLVALEITVVATLQARHHEVVVLDRHLPVRLAALAFYCLAERADLDAPQLLRTHLQETSLDQCHATRLP